MTDGEKSDRVAYALRALDLLEWCAEHDTMTARVILRAAGADYEAAKLQRVLKQSVLDIEKLPKDEP